MGIQARKLLIVKYPQSPVSLSFTTGEDEFSTPDAVDAYRQRLTTTLAGGRVPDVFLFNYRELGVFSKSGVLEPLGTYLAQSSIIHEADFYSLALKPFYDKNGSLQCVPQNASPLVVYYNKALFENAGLPLPTAGWTWDEFLKDAQALTKNVNDPRNAQYGVGLKLDLPHLLPFIWQKGGLLVDSDTTPTQFQFGTAETRAGLQQFVDLRQKYQVTPSEEAAISFTPVNRFLAGSVGMIFFSRRLTPTLRKANFDWDVVPLPMGKQAATVLFADGYCIFKASQQKDKVWAFIEFAASAEGQTILTKAGRSVPSLKTVAESSVFLDTTTKPDHDQAFLDALQVARLAPYSPSWAAIEEEANRHLQAGYYGGVSFEEMVAQIQSKTAEWFK
jgi:multiple sugar transport system substrate-binding protein